MGHLVKEVLAAPEMMAAVEVLVLEGGEAVMEAVEGMRHLHRSRSVGRAVSQAVEEMVAMVEVVVAAGYLDYRVKAEICRTQAELLL
jgi:hypothetical protein